ncbi:DUF2141 domain-containing protein [Sphingomonas baiyangensis]|uniref:DUF2141 domain-containing protein n=1 Tax=Sphingomonas baiyangensis TaxID=2572576 RepID=A0A4U1L0V3_9SPHN|nr:DUF2141 domain-containing protein [Sphingomonas baiyangensis]TKD50401.1 DUF2141 domain-containing protein [Sphingomonas baiyangensis]
MIAKLLTAATLGAMGGLPAPAQAEILGSDAQACAGGQGPAIRVNVAGLKDRTGRLKLELYPANDEDFLKDDRDLVKEGKFFRRVWADMPANGAVSLCIKAPRAGRYALLFTHDRDGKNKFNFWRDGAGFPSNEKLGRSRPKLAQAVIAVGGGVTTTTIRAQYMRGLNGFGPV